jgi:hypothetical protein
MIVATFLWRRIEQAFIVTTHFESKRKKKTKRKSQKTENTMNKRSYLTKKTKRSMSWGGPSNAAYNQVDAEDYQCMSTFRVKATQPVLCIHVRFCLFLLMTKIQYLQLFSVCDGVYLGC